MPFPSDEKLMVLAKDVLEVFDTLFGLHPGFRPVHAKGVLVTGTFTPSADAAALTRAPHATRPSTPVLVRFSNTTGVPVIPDNDPNADPRGMAIRFQLAEHVHTDIIGHSVNGFPAKNGQEFLEFLRAVMASASAKTSPSPIEQFLGTHPAALAFVTGAKPPSSFARAAYFPLTAFRFTNGSGVIRHGRYTVVPAAGVENIDLPTAQSKGPNYLFDELTQRIAAGPITFNVNVQVADEGDVVDDVTVHWPDSRKVVDLGKVVLTAIAPDNASQQKQIIFDPLPRVDGIEPSADPLLELRAGMYLLSGRRRRQAP